MKESKIISYTRNICRQYGLHYKIKQDGRGARLYLYSIITGHYIQVCFDLFNLDEAQIAEMVPHFKNLYFCV